MNYSNKIYHYLVFTSLIMFLSSTSLFAQKYGTFTGSFESINEQYEDDDDIKAKAPKDKYGSNSYLDLNYNYKYFSAGARYEIYSPALQGYPMFYDKSDIAYRYFSFIKDNLSITVGNFYEQYGSGLLFRAFEERQLGIDNSVDGVRFRYSLTDYIDIKAMYGKHRKGFDRSDGVVRGVYSIFNINKLLNISRSNLFKIEFGGVNKYENYTGSEDDFPTSVDAFSGRFSYEGNFSNFNIEYVSKSNDPIMNDVLNEGKALFSSASYFRKGFSLSGLFRRLENFSFYSERNESSTALSVNYVPSLAKQFGYSLTNVYVYSAQVNNEIGYQFDLFYKIPKKTFLGGRYGTLISANFASYWSLKFNNMSDTEFFAFGDDLFYTDFNIKIDRKWNKSFKTIFLYNYKKYNKEFIEGKPVGIVTPHIAVVDVLYKWNRKRSVRVELQHLSVDNDMKSWIGGMTEFNFAPTWSMHFADDFNYGNDSPMHYYSVGGSYTKGVTRISISYGRRRGGISCVGGVCRLVPAIKGISLSIVSKF